MPITIEQDILIEAPVEAVWRTLTEAEHIARWFAVDVDLEATPGYDGTLRFTASPENEAEAPRSLTVRVEVRSVDPERTFSYRWQHPPGARALPGNSLLVTFTLHPEAGGTRLRVVETGMEDMGWTPGQVDTYLAEHTEGWITHLGRLRDQLVGRPADPRP